MGIHQQSPDQGGHHLAPLPAELGVITKTLRQIERRKLDVADASVAAIEIGADRHAFDGKLLRPFRMAARKKPKLLAILGEHKIHKALRRSPVGSAFENRQSVRVDRGEVLREGEHHVGPARDRNLSEAVEVDREGIRGLAQRHVFGGGRGDAIELADISSDLREHSPAFLPSVELQKGFEHDVHRPAVPWISRSHPAHEPRVGQLLPPSHRGQTEDALHSNVLQYTEAGQRCSIPSVIRAVDVHAVQALRDPGHDLGRRLVGKAEFLVRQNQERLLASPKKAVDTHAFRFPGKLGLDEAQRVRSASHVPPFHLGGLPKMRLVPPGKTTGELGADGVNVRSDNDDPLFGWQRNSAHRKEQESDPQPLASRRAGRSL